MYRNPILACGKKLDYQPLLDHIKRIGYAPENQSRMILSGLWNCSSLQEQVCYMEKNFSDDSLEGFTGFESEKVFIEMGMIYRKTKKYQLAEKFFQKALEIDEDAMPIYNELGRLYVEQGKYEEAESVFRKAVEKGNIPSYNELGRLYVEQGKYEEAESVFRKAMEIDEDAMPIYNELGRLYVEQGKYEEAESVFRKAMEIDEDDIPSYNELGRLYVKWRKYKEAESMFRKAVEKGNLASYTELGRLYVKWHKSKEAESVFRKAVEKGNLASYNELGRLYVEQGKYEEAESVFRKALGKNFENDSYILVSLMKLYSKTNNCNKADALIKQYTNKTTAFYNLYCRCCYTYIKNAKGLKEALKYKKQVQKYNKKFQL